MNGVQIIELHTDQPDKFERLLARWQDTPGGLPAAPRVCRDRFDMGHFVLFLDDPTGMSAHCASRSDEPTMQDWAADLVDLLDSRPRFLDLDGIPPPR